MKNWGQVQELSCLPEGAAASREASTGNPVSPFPLPVGVDGTVAKRPEDKEQWEVNTDFDWSLNWSWYKLVGFLLTVYNQCCPYRGLCNRRAAGRSVSFARCWGGWPLRGAPWVWGNAPRLYIWLLSARSLGRSRDHKYTWLETLWEWAGSAWEKRWRGWENMLGGVILLQQASGISRQWYINMWQIHTCNAED